ncbi:MAG: GNAT family N-acetyltransferase [Ruminococcus sp.]|nr:GNAT family N-acetyltransferase [Ruminococcus sp.]
MNNEIRIETDRLLLRPLMISDAEDVFEWTGDAVVNRYMPYPLYTDSDDVRKWIASLKAEKFEFAFVLKSENKVIGSGSVHAVDDDGVYELGYNFNRKYWNNGYATETAKAMIKWAHDELGVHNFKACHANANTASGNVLKKCGFEFTEFGQYSRYDGSETFDASFYRLHIE